LPFRLVLQYLQCIVWFCHKTRVCQTDGGTADGQNYDSKDRASIAASRSKTKKGTFHTKVQIHSISDKEEIATVGHIMQYE